MLPGGGGGAPGSNGPFGGSGFGGTVPLGAAMLGLSALGLAGIVLVTRRRRRPDGEAAVLEPLPALVESRHAPALVLLPPGTPPEEADIPRWRRPSLRQARAREIRVGYASPPVPITFHAKDTTGLERRIVRYRLVRLSSIPDEIMGDEVGRLDSGDEVDVVRSAGEYVLVRTPHGAEGWVHRMTLGGTEAAEA
jgi:hypothetical protein